MCAGVAALIAVGPGPDSAPAQSAPAQSAPAQSAPAPPPGNPSAELVVLVHGLGRTELSMLPLAGALERDGFQVLNWGYSSFCCTVAELAQQLKAELDNHPMTATHRVHFVGHSLGSVIVRLLLARSPPAFPGNVVMIAPPNQGARSADRYAPFLGWLLRPLPELTTGGDNPVRSLALPPDTKVGIIVGQYDRTVTVDETRLDKASAYAIVPAAHTFLMLRPDVRRLTTEFLRGGHFGLP